MKLNITKTKLPIAAAIASLEAVGSKNFTHPTKEPIFDHWLSAKFIKEFPPAKPSPTKKLIKMFEASTIKPQITGVKLIKRAIRIKLGKAFWA